MNRHGETFEERPLPGEYKVCPLHGCRYKLYVGPPDITMGVRTAQWEPGVTIAEVVEATVRRELKRQEGLIKAHLQTHPLMDFYTTRAHIMGEAVRRADEITKLADLAFLSTATQETETEGG